MAKKTYEVSVTACALKTFTVKAKNAREATDKIVEKIDGLKVGEWTIDCPGAADEHFSTSLDGKELGPYSCETYEDEDEDEDDEGEE